MSDKKVRKIVIYYSLEGSTRFIAEAIAKAVDADMLELNYEKEVKSRGFIKYLWGGKQILFKEKPKILPATFKPEDYDLIFVGTPVWVGTFTPPLRTFFSRVAIKGKDLALFCCHKGGPGKVLDKLKQVMPDNRIIGEADFLDPLHKNKDNHKVQGEEWAKSVVKNRECRGNSNG